MVFVIILHSYCHNCYFFLNLYNTKSAKLFCTGLHVRFRGLLARVHITPTSEITESSKDLGFDDDIFIMAAALDPNFGFRWLEDLTCSSGDKEELRQEIIGMIYIVLVVGVQ